MSVSLALVGGSAAAPASTAAPAPGADLLLVVDCLLPGQVRSLGQRTTYLSARRPARLPARDCQIRGGEYVAYDRADLSSALGAWLPLAEQGDTEAQVIVGEIYERGLGVPPDHAAAARWYGIAADAGNRRAQVNLGHLYESGLGVARDPAVALDWYRRAAGTTAGIEIDAGPPQQDTPVQAVDPQEAERLRSRAQELAAALDSLTTELEATRRALDTARGEAMSAQQAAEAAREAAARAEAQRPLFQPPPDRSTEVQALQQELQRRQAEAAELERQLQAIRAEQQLQLQRLDSATRETAQARRAAEEQRAGLLESAACLTAQQEELERRSAEVERLARDLAAARRQAERQAGEIERLRSAAQAQLVAGPELALIEPSVEATRDIVRVSASDATERQVVGRVTAPAGLVTLTVNDRAVTPNELGVFSATLAVAAGDLPVKIVAVDRQGKRSDLSFLLRRSLDAAASEPGVTARGGSMPAAGVKFGRYQALIIANDDYRQLPDLSTPLNDAARLEAVLQQRYGFRTTVLRNATRYEILSALNRMREALTAEDNLLIYYAGHGELDEVNQRAYWLPVDSERDSTANWIPTTAITDLLNIMKAKQVLLVVDSCYAGALTRSAVGRLATGMTAEEQLHWLRTMSSRRSRTVLTSGGVAPVLDAGGGGHSVFARALLEVLAANTEVIDGQRLHRDVAARVAYAAANLRFDQVPEYAPIRFAGHEAGEFFLVPEG